MTAFWVHHGLFRYTVSVTEGSSNPGARLVSAGSPYPQPLGLLGPEDHLCDLTLKPCTWCGSVCTLTHLTLGWEVIGPSAVLGYSTCVLC